MMSRDQDPRARDPRDAHDARDTREEAPRSRQPSHIAYQVREAEDGKSYFNRVGASFPHKDGKGFNVELDAMPVNGRLTLRTPQERLQESRSDAPRGRDDRDGRGR